jgi:hypothetical protein
MLVLHLESQGDDPAPQLLRRSLLHRRHHRVNGVAYAYRTLEVPLQTEKRECSTVNEAMDMLIGPCAMRPP